MKKNIFLLVLFLISSSVVDAQNIPINIEEEVRTLTSMADGTHHVTLSGKTYLIEIKHHKIATIKRMVIPEIIRTNMNVKLVNLIEEAYAAHLLAIDNHRFNDIRCLEGEWNMLEGLQQNVAYNITVENNLQMIVSFASGKQVLKLEIPIDYQKFHAGSRTEVEDSFIEGLLDLKETQQRPLPRYRLSDLKKKGENLYMLPGDHYHLGSVNRNTYLTYIDNLNMDFIIDSQQPLLTIANMIVLGIGYKSTLNMSISRHEYGEKTNLKLPLETFLQYCFYQGCQIYWGYDKTKASILNGTIFCYNESQGYEHILRIKCDTTKLGSEDFEMLAIVSLFVPTTNTKNGLHERR